MATFSHPTAVIDAGAEIGEGTKIWHFCHVMSRARIGARCVLGQNVYVGNVRIGDGVKIQNNVSVYDGVTLEDYVFCGPSCVFTNVINPRSELERKDQYRPTLVRRGATIGANATILCGCTIGEFAMVGAGAVVRGDVLPYSLMVGVPAKRIGWMCRCGVRLPADLSCTACGARYVSAGGGIAPAG
jgi:UDP-2-acetamido-3-amino-2,3-dideoxy-glucuronate N-acetyltransferase